MFAEIPFAEPGPLPVEEPASSAGWEMLSPDGRTPGSGRNRGGQSFYFRNVTGTPCFLLRPAADNRDIDVGETKGFTQQKGTGNVFLDDQPSVSPYAPRHFAG